MLNNLKSHKVQTSTALVFITFLLKAPPEIYDTLNTPEEIPNF